MAKIVSPVWSSARGSIAGTTYLTTASGQIIARQRTRPVNTPSVFRTWIKDAMIWRAAQWNAITQSARDQWDIYAAANGFTSGRVAFMSGTVFAAFCLLTNLAGAAVISVFDSKPETNGKPNCTVSPGIQSGAGTTSVAVKVANNGALRALLYIEVSPGLNPARTYWKGPWDTTRSQCVVLLSGVTTTYQITGLTVAERYFIKVRALTNDLVVGARGNRIQAAMIINQIAVLNI